MTEPPRCATVWPPTESPLRRLADIHESRRGAVAWLEATTWLTFLLYAVTVSGTMANQGVSPIVAWSPLLGPILVFRWIHRLWGHFVATRTRSRSPRTVRILCRMLCVALPMALVPLQMGALYVLLPYLQAATAGIAPLSLAPFGVVFLVGWLMLLRPRQTLAWWQRRRRSQ